MAGIDSIIDRILKDARESADARVARAEQDAEKALFLRMTRNVSRM